MAGTASDLARALARNAEAVCRHYLDNGRKSGRYWLVGDTDNTPGTSLYVRLSGSEGGRGAAGKWCDAATGQHGDLLDLIAASQRLGTVRETCEEARRFLGQSETPRRSTRREPRDATESARRLWAAAKPITRTLAETYLRNRNITANLSALPLRFHPRCFWQSASGSSRMPRPAILAAVTDASGAITGLHRTWLTLDGHRISDRPARKALGQLLGNGVRFGSPGPSLVVGEGIETVLSCRSACPDIPAIAALSSSHLAALEIPASLQRLYIAADNDEPGRQSAARLAERAGRNVAVYILLPTHGDWNDDLRLLGLNQLRAAMHAQMEPADIA